MTFSVIFVFGKKNGAPFQKYPFEVGVFHFVQCTLYYITYIITTDVIPGFVFPPLSSPKKKYIYIYAY